jgi:iron complex transport system substrate-binding protein
MTKKKRTYWIAILACLMIGAICGQGICFPVKEADDRKKEIQVAAKPGRIISLGPTPTELLFALGLEKEIVGVSRYCDYPEAAKKKEKVGGFVDVDIEKIASLRPDLIVAFGTLQLPVVDALDKRGFTVFWIYPNSVNDILNSFTRIGRITGAVREAAELRTSVERELATLRSDLGNIPEAKRTAIFRVMSFNTRATIGADSFQTELFSLAGGRNAFPASGQDYIELDAQELSKSDPGAVLVCGDDEKDLKLKMTESPLYKDLTAVKNGSVLVMPCELTCRPGPRIAEAARRLARFLYPAVKP